LSRRHEPERARGGDRARRTVNGVTRPVTLGLGVLLVLVGAVWFLQGIDVLGGSGMSGKTLWAVIGPVVALVGVAILVWGRRRPGAGRDL
jgi:hypothetical protein